jgi:hypothetical protein
MTRPAPSPDSDPYADRRVYPRVPVALPAFLQAGGVRLHVRLLDLSAGGARVQGAVALDPGTSVVLDCGIIGRAATVRWQNGDTLGLAFDQELDELDVAALTARSQALAAWMDNGR